MRPVAIFTCALLLTGCAGGTSAALSGQDAKSKLAVKDHALTSFATSELTVIVQAAQAWSAAHGGVMTGFAADLQQSQPSVASTALVLTDTSASVATGSGQCVTATLPQGATTAHAC